MNEFIRLDDGLYYRRDAFTTFNVIEESERTGGGFQSFDNGAVAGLIPVPYQHTPTGRWQLLGRIDGTWHTICTMNTREAIAEFAAHEFMLQI